MRLILSVLFSCAQLSLCHAQDRTVIIQQLGISLRVPWQFSSVFEEGRFHTFSGSLGTVKVYLSARCCKSPRDSVREAIARARSGRNPRSYRYLAHKTVRTASGLEGVRGEFFLQVSGGKMVPFVDKYFLPLPGGGVCCVSVVSRFDDRRAYLGALVLASYQHLPGVRTVSATQ